MASVLITGGTGMVVSTVMLRTYTAAELVPHDWLACSLTVINKGQLHHLTRPLGFPFERLVH